MRRLVRKIRMETWIGICSYLVTFTLLYGATVRATREPLGSAMFSAFLSVGFFIPLNLVLSAIARAGVRFRRRVRLRDIPEHPVPVTEETESGGATDRRFRLARPGASEAATRQAASNTVSTASTRR